MGSTHGIQNDGSTVFRFWNNSPLFFTTIARAEIILYVIIISLVQYILIKTLSKLYWSWLHKKFFVVKIRKALQRTDNTHFLQSALSTPFQNIHTISKPSEFPVIYGRVDDKYSCFTFKKFRILFLYGFPRKFNDSICFAFTSIIAQIWLLHCVFKDFNAIYMISCRHLLSSSKCLFNHYTSNTN